MKNLLMLGTAKGSKEILLEAKNRGYYTIVTDYLEPKESRGKLLSDEYWMISTSDFDTLEKSVKRKILMGFVMELVLLIFQLLWNLQQD